MRITHSRLLAVIFTLIFMMSHCVLSFATDATLSGTVRDPFGNAFNGTLAFTLSQPSVDPTGVIDYVPMQVPFTVLNGTLQSGAKLISNASLQPQNTYYLGQYFDTTGLLIAQKVFYFSDGANVLGSMVPTSITTNNVSYLTPISISADNTWTGNNTFTKKIVSTVATGTAPLQVASTTPVANLGASHIVGDNSPVATSTQPILLGKNDRICWRNSDNTNDNCFDFAPGATSASDAPEFRIGATTSTFATKYTFLGYNLASVAAFGAGELQLTSNINTFAANSFAIADIYHYHADGVITNTTGGNVTYTVRFRTDYPAGAVLCASAGVVVATGSSNVPFHLNCYAMVNTIGAGGTVASWGEYNVNATNGDVTNATLVSVDSTVSHTPNFSVQPTVNSANATFTLRAAWAERIGR